MKRLALQAVLAVLIAGCIEGKALPVPDRVTTNDLPQPRGDLLGDHSSRDGRPRDGRTPDRGRWDLRTTTTDRIGPPDLCPPARICGTTCCGAGQFCLVTTKTACASVTAGSTILFATASSYGGDLGGRSGADTKCVASKPATLLCAELHAFLSAGTPSAGEVCSPDTDELRDMPANYGFAEAKPLYFYHGGTGQLRQLATSWTDALDGSIGITVATGTGASFGSWSAFWTGSGNDGSIDQSCDVPASSWNYSCLGWTSSANSSTTRAYGGVGNASSTTGWLMSTNNYLQCTNAFPILCACKL